MLSSVAPSGWQVSLPFPVEPGTRWKGSDPGQGAISRVSPVVVEQRPEPTPEALPSPGPSEALSMDYRALGLSHGAGAVRDDLGE